MASVPDDLLARIAALTPDQRTLLATRLKSQGVNGLELTGIPRRRPGSPAPLSFAQQRLWFLHRLEPGSSAYNMPFALRLGGPLNVAALHRAIEIIVARHEALRTTIAELDGDLIQAIAPPAPVMLPIVDLSELPDRERESEVLRLAAAEAQTLFDLYQGPLIRVQLLKLTQQEHVLLLTIHHIVSDGWSMGVLFSELATLYEAFANGRPS